MVNIKVYLSKTLPPYLSVLTDQIKDTLEEYRIYAGGNIDIEYIDPGDDPSMQQKLRFMGIPLLRLNVIEKDKAAVTDVFMGLAVLYGDNKEIIPALTDTSTLEYELTSKILRVTNSEIQTIGFLSGHGEPHLQKELGIINNELQDQFYTRTILTSDGKKIPDDVSVLVVASPKEMSARDMFEIDQFIMSGGKVIFLIDTVDIEARSLRGRPRSSPVAKLVEHYGVKVRQELVLDQLNAQASFQSGPYSIYVPYPFWVQIVRQSIDSDHPIIYGLESMVLPWASPVEIIENRTKDMTVTVLAQSSEYSWVQKGFFDLSPQNDVIPPEDQMKKHVMAVAISGKFNSYFADKTVPPVEKQDNNRDKKATGNKPATEENRPVIKQSHETKIIVVGNSRFITDNFTGQFDGNRTFFLNAIDWFTIGDYLIDIRSRDSGERPLIIISGRTKTAVRAVNIFGVPVLLAVFGLFRFLLRRRRKRLGVVL